MPSGPPGGDSVPCVLIPLTRCTGGAEIHLLFLGAVSPTSEEAPGNSAHICDSPDSELRPSGSRGRDQIYASAQRRGARIVRILTPPKVAPRDRQTPNRLPRSLIPTPEKGLGRSSQDSRVLSDSDPRASGQGVRAKRCVHIVAERRPCTKVSRRRIWRPPLILRRRKSCARRGFTSLPPRFLLSS